jgi:hypothetical protein
VVASWGLAGAAVACRAFATACGVGSGLVGPTILELGGFEVAVFEVSAFDGTAGDPDDDDGCEPKPCVLKLTEHPASTQGRIRIERLFMHR